MPLKDNEAKSAIKSIIHHLPWKEFLGGVFVPLSLLYFFIGMKESLIGVILSIGWCFLMLVVEWGREKKLSIFPLITAVMIFINAGTSFFRDHPVYHIYLEAADNMVFAVIFLGSVLIGKPIILKFVREDSIKQIPEKIRKTPYFIKAWNIVTCTWGFSYLVSAFLLVYLNKTGSKHLHLADFLFGWPVMMFLLVFSVLFPRLYWSNNWHKIEEEFKEKYGDIEDKKQSGKTVEGKESDYTEEEKENDEKEKAIDTGENGTGEKPDDNEGIDKDNFESEDGKQDGSTETE